MMKKSRILLCVFFGIVSSVFAQQESQYTQYMYNTIMVNPAYAGSRDVGTFFGMHRAQWIGINGAPNTSAISYNSPISSKNLGFGVSLFHESIGPVVLSSISGDFSYALDFENSSKLAFGLKATLGYYSVNFSKLNVLHPNDPSYAKGTRSLFNPNIGAGLYWYSDNYYLGLSVPNLLQTDYYRTKDNKDKNEVSVVRNTQHFYVIGGYVFELNDNIKFKPAVLSKIVQGSPLQLDVSANFMFNERFIFGAAYRWSAAVSAMAGFQINSNWFIGYAYDYDTTELNRYSSGSHEVFLRYELFKAKDRIISPRFF